MIPSILNCLVIIIIAHKYVETIEEYLANCSIIRNLKDAWSGGGLLGKIMRGGTIAVILMMPKLSARRGLIDTTEVKTLPKFYKKILIIPAITAITLLLSMLTLRILGYFYGF